MKQDVTVDGIPNYITHTHDIRVQVVVDQETTKNIKDIGLTLIGAVTLGYLIRTAASFGARAGSDFLWKRM